MRVLEFHHRNPDDKDFGIADMRTRSVETLDEEIAKCDVVCANCHKIIHWEMDNENKEVNK